MSQNDPQKKFTLIPDKDKKLFGGMFAFRGNNERYREPFWFGLSVFLFLGVWGAFVLWGNLIQSSQDRIEQEKQSLEDQIDNRDRDRLQSFIARLETIKDNINNTEYSSEFLSLFARTVPAHITITSFRLNLEEKELEISAFTPRSGSGGGLSEYEGQFIFWRDYSSDVVTNARRVGWSQTGDGVEFQMAFDINPATLLRNASDPNQQEQSTESQTQPPEQEQTPEQNQNGASDSIGSEQEQIDPSLPQTPL